MSSNILEKNNQSFSTQNSEAQLLESQVNELIASADSLFKVFDHTSTIIRQLEKTLTDNKIRFSYFPVVEREGCTQMIPMSEINLLGDRMSDKYGVTPQAYYKSNFWHLGWTPIDDTTKSWRLILEHKEVTFAVLQDGSEVSYDPETLLKKPLIECDVNTRLRFSKYLISFINGFKGYLDQYRLGIQSGEILQDGNFAEPDSKKNLTSGTQTRPKRPLQQPNLKTKLEEKTESSLEDLPF